MHREASFLLLGAFIYKAIRFISHSLNNGNPPVAVDDSSEDGVISTPTTKYDVFLSFRGEDTRDTFSSYLYEALCNASIKTFMDHKLHKGDDISPILLKTIEESEISLIVFSNDYASSSWCMNELIHIMKCKEKHGRIVIPIFYHVDPSNVRKQNGSFGDGFTKLKQRFMHDKERVHAWKDALIRSANLSGWDSKNTRPESKLIKMIIKDILSKLNNKSSFHSEGLVGIVHRIQKIEELLSEARIVGICGMGGIGKTTLAGAVFDRLSAKFEGSSFVGNVREQLGKIGFDQLVEKCLKELLKDEDMNTYNFRSTFVKNRLQCKKILLVLDDVDNYVAIDDLITACGWFGEGSRIIITSRDKEVLNNTSASTTYHVQKLELPHALHLFSLNAFKQNEPSKSYFELSTHAVNYCEGNPLALKVLGCFLHRRGIDEWGSAMENLSQNIHKNIFNVLKLSFDGLDNDTQKNAFLDLAFFFKEAWWICMDHMIRLYTLIDICVLRDRSLISVHNCGLIYMHSLLIDMGLEISRQQLISNPEKPTRLWRHKDIYNLVNIDDKHFPNLEEIDLAHSKDLIALPDLSHAPKIESINLRGCVNLAQIHSSTLPGKYVIHLGMGDKGPVQIKFGGSTKGQRSGLMMVYNYLDLEKWSINKVTMKVFVCGKTISGVRFKHVVVPLADEEDLRSRMLNLASLFPFVGRLEWLESPIEFGDDFKLRHYMSHLPVHHVHNLRYYHLRHIGMHIYRGGREGREEEDDDLMREEERYGKSSTLMVEVEEEGNNELIMECYEGNIFTRLPKSITRWSLLTELILKESEIIWDDDCREIKPHLDVQISFHDIPPSASSDYTSSSISYFFDDISPRQRHPYPDSFYFKLCANHGLTDSNNHEIDKLLSLVWCELY